MGEMGEVFREWGKHKKERRERLGVPCEGCKVKFPKAHPKILLPGQKCFCGYKDERRREDFE